MTILGPDVINNDSVALELLLDLPVMCVKLVKSGAAPKLLWLFSGVYIFVSIIALIILISLNANGTKAIEGMMGH